MFVLPITYCCTVKLTKQPLETPHFDEVEQQDRESIRADVIRQLSREIVALSKSSGQSSRKSAHMKKEGVLYHLIEELQYLQEDGEGAGPTSSAAPVNYGLVGIEPGNPTGGDGGKSYIDEDYEYP
mmetsp:Transcript_12014/g.19872  ORF Transcript_12014/g.19872 Transcript_12014/m.19872 type:complete len:126 (+) Transcript_12014:1756-2133(+)